METIDSSLQKPKEEDLSKIYTVQSSLWYKSVPYTFGFTKIGELKTSTIYVPLPINPQNIQISTSFSTNVINSLYGVIEEHSEQRWYDIQISGTTGIAPKYQITESEKSLIELVKPEKTRFSYSEDTNSFFDNSASLFLGSLSEIAQKMTLYYELFTNSSSKKIDSGLRDDLTGYKAFHDLYRFFLMYKEEVSKNNKNDIKIHPLRFYNYKDNVCYDVIPINFTMQKSAESPMLYYYQISLKGYNMREISKDENIYEKEMKEKAFGFGGYDSSLKQNYMLAEITNKLILAKNAIVGTLLTTGVRIK